MRCPYRVLETKLRRYGTVVCRFWNRCVSIVCTVLRRKCDRSFKPGLVSLPLCHYLLPALVEHVPSPLAELHELKNKRGHIYF